MASKKRPAPSDEASSAPHPKKHNTEEDDDMGGDGDFEEEMALLEQMESEMTDSPEFLGEGKTDILDCEHFYLFINYIINILDYIINIIDDLIFITNLPLPLFYLYTTFYFLYYKTILIINILNRMCLLVLKVLLFIHRSSNFRPAKVLL